MGETLWGPHVSLSLICVDSKIYSALGIESMK
jgi:hypothetical protein